MNQTGKIWRAMVKAGWADKTTTEAAGELRRRLRLCAAVPRKGLWAVAELEAFTEDGSRRKIKALLDQERQGWLGPDGEPLTTTDRYAVAERDPKTKARTGKFQEVQLKLMTWTQFAETRARFEQERARRARILRILDLIDKLRVLYPDTATPFEAMLLHGINPRDALINLSKLA